MNHYIKDDYLFAHISKLYNSIDKSKINIQDTHLFREYHIDSDSWKLPDFWTLINNHSIENGDEIWYCYANKPDPLNYFKYYFGCYPIVIGNSFPSGKEFVEPLDMNPLDSPADSITNRAELVSFFSNKASWLIQFDNVSERVHLKV
jgi:hypothetical protein